ncbi:catecholate siderophore receptor Fiu [soil metagenome]
MRSQSLAASLIAPSLAALCGFAGVAKAAEPVTDAPQTLSGVEVTAQANAQKRALGLSTGLSQSVQDTPQIVNVIPKELIQQQKITTLEQALRDSPGITVAIGEGGTLAGDQFKIRGLDANNDIYTDGLRDFGVYTRDAFDYQEVQVLKGPSGAMFGRGTTGGAINTISKQPETRHDFLNVDAAVGTGDYYRVTADLNHKINDTTAVRFNVMGNSTGVTGRDKVGSDRWGFAASAGFGLGTKASFVVNYLHQQDQRVPDYGIIIGAPTGVIRALPATEYGLSQRVFEQFATDQDRTRADILTARFKYDISPALSLSSDTRLGSYDRYFQYTSVDSCLVNAVTKQTCIDALIDNNPATRPLITFGGGGPYSQRAWGFQNISALHGVFDVGGFKNEFVVGTDFNRQENRKAFSAYTLPPLSSGIYAPGTLVPARNAIAINLLTGAGDPPAGYSTFRPRAVPGVAATGIPGTSITSAAYITDSIGEATEAAGFVTDRLWFTPQLSLIAGARYSVYDAQYSNLLISGVRQTFKATSHLTSPRASLVYEPSDSLTIYTSYGKSATPVGSAIVGNATPISGATAAFDPDLGETYEFGAKGALFGGRIGWDAAYFHVNKDNAKQTDPTSGEISSQSSQKQTFEGAELGLNGKITADWSANVAYTYIDARVRQDLACTTVAPIRCYQNPYTVGGPVLQVPRNSAFVWSSYRLRAIAPGLSVAGGFTYQDGYHVRYTTTGTAPNLVLTRDAQVPSTFSLDGLIQYETRAWRVALNLYNLTDRLNYGQSFGNRAAPAQGRTAILTVGRSF